MSKLMRNLLFGVVAVLVIGAVAVWLAPMIQENRAEAAKTPIPKSVYIINYGADYTVDGFEVTRRDSDEVTAMESHLDESGGSRIWVMRDYPEASVNAYNIASVTGVMKNLGSSGTAAEDLTYKANFGLDDPAYTVKIHYANGESVTLYIGDENPGKTGYYVIREGDERIYIVNTLNVHYLTTEYYGYWALPVFAGAAETLTEVRVERLKENEVVHLLVVPSGSYGNVNTGRLIEPYDIQADVDAQEEFVTLVADQIKGPTGLVNPEPTAEDLASYGLAEPLYKVTVKTAADSITLTLGDLFDTELSIENAFRYCLVNDDPAVYRMNSADLNGVVDVQAASLADPLLNYISLSYLESLDFTSGDLKVHADVEQIITDENGDPVTIEDSVGMTSTTIEQAVKVNGREVDRRTFGTWYTYVVGLRVYGELPEGFEPEGEAAAELICRLNVRSTGMSERVIRFYEYRHDFYAVEIDGKFDFYVDHAALQDIIDNARVVLE